MRLISYYKQSRYLKDSSYKLYSLILFVTNRCNGECVGCLYSEKLNVNNDNNTKDLTLNEIKKIPEELGRIYHLQISGGEPFLRKDLPEICKLFVQGGTKLITIPTNGLISCKESIRKILSYNCKLGVGISIDGIDGKIRKGYKKALKTYLELKKEFGKNKRFSIQIQSRISNYNFRKIPELVKIIKKADSNVIHALFPIRGKLVGIAPPTPEQYYKLYKIISNRDITSILNFWLNLGLLNGKRWPVSCVAGEKMLVIESDGDVRPCELLKSIGNIRHNNLKEIWKRKKYQGNECLGCTHGCFLTPSLFQRPTISLLFAIKSRIFFLLRQFSNK